MTFVCTFFIVYGVHVFFFFPLQAFTQPDDSLSPELLPANAQASCLPPWRPTTCQVTVATREEGTRPMATDTYPPTHLESVMCDLHPWFLSKMPLKFFFLSFLIQIGMMLYSANLYYLQHYRVALQEWYCYYHFEGVEVNQMK